MPDELQDKGHHYTPGPAYTGGMPGMAGPMPGMAGPMPGMGGPMGGHVHPPCGPGPSHSPNNFLLGIESAKDLYDLAPGMQIQRVKFEKPRSWHLVRGEVRCD